MSQTPLGLNSINPSGFYGPTRSAYGGALTTTLGGSNSKLNLAAGTTVIKATAGTVCRISVNTASTSGNLTVYDQATTTSPGASTLVYTALQAAVVVGANLVVDFPCLTGIVITVPTSAVVSVSFN